MDNLAEQLDVIECPEYKFSFKMRLSTNEFDIMIYVLMNNNHVSIETQDENKFIYDGDILVGMFDNYKRVLYYNLPLFIC